ncbi:MAG: YHS domain-containing protein [Thermoanaerobaculum sp.]
MVVAVVALLFAVTLGWAAEPEAFKPQQSCPVSGKPIDKNVYLDYQGQRIYFCCPRCPAEFRKNPEKYFAKFEAEGVELESVQKACAVCGKPLAKGEGQVTHFKGRTVRSCSPECQKQFLAQPEKVLDKLPGEQQEVPKAPLE